MDDARERYAKQSEIAVLAPVIRAQKGSHVKVFEKARKRGFEEAYVDGRLLARGVLSDGSVQLVVGPFADIGLKHVEVRYLGDDRTLPADTTGFGVPVGPAEIVMGFGAAVTACT